MSVILEGFDNSGKSTLANMLRRDTGATIYYPGPKPVGVRDIVRQMKQQSKWSTEKSAILDRVTFLSQPCYMPPNDWRSGLDMTIGSVLAFPSIFRTLNNATIVYCRPPIEKIKDFSTHQVKSYDDEKKLRWLEENVDMIVERYDRHMLSFPHEVWDYTNPDLFVYQKLVWELT